MNTGPLSRIRLMQYGFLAAPVAFAGYPLYILAPDFYASHRGVSLSVLGLLLLGLRTFDALEDPIVGVMSDRYAHKIFPWMFVCALLLVVSIYALFHPIHSHAVVWFAGCMALAVTAYSILSINLNALGALWTRAHHEQTRIAMVREACGLAGLLLAVIAPGLLGKHLPLNQVYSCFSAILAVLMLMALLGFRRWFLGQTLRTHSHDQHVSLFATLRTLPRHTCLLFGVYGLSVLASSIPAVLVIFFIRDRLHAETYTGLFLVLYFLSGALMMPVWKNISTRYGKHQAWFFSMLLAVASFVWAFLLGSGDVWQYAFICVTSGTALGADLVLPPSILGDHIHATSAASSAATQFSILTLLAKAGLALGAAIALPILDYFSFKPAQHNTETALLSLSVAYALIPCLLKLAASCLLYFLFIQRKEPTHETYIHNTMVGSRHHA